jgi:hypothetical protein
MRTFTRKIGTVIILALGCLFQFFCSDADPIPTSSETVPTSVDKIQADPPSEMPEPVLAPSETSPSTTPTPILIQTNTEVIGIVDPEQIEDSLTWLMQFGTMLSDDLCKVGIDENGQVYILGVFGAETDYGAGITQYLLKLDSNGNTIWQKKIGPATGNSTDLSLIVKNSNEIFVAGEIGGKFEDSFSGTISHQPTFVYKFNGSGEILWDTVLMEGDCARLGDIALDQEGSLFAAGSKRKGNDCSEGSYSFLQKLNQDGTAQWVNQYDLNGLTLQLAADPAESLYLVGSQSTPPKEPDGRSEYMIVVRKININGEEMWTALIDSPVDDFIEGATSDAEGNLYVLFQSGSPYLAKIDPMGNRIWLHQLDPREVRDMDLTLDPEGNVFVLIYYDWVENGKVKESVELIKLESTGAPSWKRVFPESWEIWPRTIAIGSGGAIYIGGDSFEVLPGGGEYGAGDVFLVKLTP